jgi:hypothetical protein
MHDDVDLHALVAQHERACQDLLLGGCKFRKRANHFPSEDALCACRETREQTLACGFVRSG